MSATAAPKKLAIQKEELEELVRKGYTNAQIGIELGKAECTIAKYKTIYGIRSRRCRAEEQSKAGEITKEKLLQMQEEGKTTIEIAEEFDVTPQTIINKRKAFGIPQMKRGAKRKKKEVTEKEIQKMDEEEKIITLIDNGYLKKEVEEKLNTSTATINRVLKKNGINLNERKKNEKIERKVKKGFKELYKKEYGKQYQICPMCGKVIVEYPGATWAYTIVKPNGDKIKVCRWNCQMKYEKGEEPTYVQR